MTCQTFMPAAIHGNRPALAAEPDRKGRGTRAAPSGALLLALATLIATAGYGEGDVLIDDFTPCWGAPQGQSIAPARGRVLIASSSNGLDFKRLTDPEFALVVDRVGVPDAVVLPSGRILLYFVAGCKYYDGAEHATDEIAVGVSDTNGSDWVFKNVEFTGVPGSLSRAVDPNVVLLPGGELSLFGTMWAANDPKPRFYSFLSTDGGFTYAFNGLRYDPPGSLGVLDPENYRFSDTNWQILTGGPDGHALSTDGGNTFTDLGSFSETYVTHEVAVTDVPGAYRAYVLGEGGLAIRSFRSDADPWTAWTLEAGERLTLSTTSTLEYCGLGFPTVVKTPSIGYLMLYQTSIPGCGCEGDATPCALACSATAAPATGGVPLQVLFTGASNAVGWVPAPAYSWSFGDGGTSTDASPVHAYTAAGSYDWAVTVTAGGETCTQSGSVTVALPTGRLRRVLRMKPVTPSP